MTEEQENEDDRRTTTSDEQTRQWVPCCCERHWRIERETEERRAPAPRKSLWKIFIKSRMIRTTSQCLFFILVATCGGVILNRALDTVSDYEQLSDIIQSQLLMEVRLRPVLLQDFKSKLRTSKSHYDFLRIFFDKVDLTDHMIDELMTSETVRNLHIYDAPSRTLSRKVRYKDSEDFIEEEESDVMLDEHYENVQFTKSSIEKAYDHWEEMNESQLRECKDPKPEITYVRNVQPKNRLYFPGCTVIHRCRNVSGCCGNASMECAPKTIQVITKSFFVLELFHDEYVRPEQQLVEDINFINHTECECRAVKKGLPSCNKACPVPFTLTRPKEECVCKCRQDNRHCIKIQNGFASLREGALRCIKRGECMEPICEYGTFDIMSGYCREPEENSNQEESYRHQRQKRYNRHRGHNQAYKKQKH